MREVCLLVVVICATLESVPQGQVALAPAIAEARTALGGRALDAVATIAVRGKAVRVLGPLAIDSELELRVRLPDALVRIDRIAVAGSAAETVTGFAGGAAIQGATGPSGVRMDAAAVLPEVARGTAGRAVVQTMRQELDLLVLGLFAGSIGGYPLTLGAAGLAESPDGRADVVAATGGAGFSGRLFIDGRTRLPLMVSWMAPDAGAAVRRAMGRAGAAPSLSTEALLAHAAPVEHRLYFLDHRPVAGLRWPHRFRRAVAGQTVEEWTIDAFVLNPALPGDAFDPQP
jgi:hypothetical protein